MPGRIKRIFAGCAPALSASSRTGVGGKGWGKTGGILPENSHYKRAFLRDEVLIAAGSACLLDGGMGTLQLEQKDHFSCATGVTNSIEKHWN